MIVSPLPSYILVHAAPIRIVTPLPGLIVGYPGEVIMQSFVYEGAPIEERSLSLAGENIAKSGKFKFRRELQSDNTTKIFLEIPEPQEDDSGLLNITLTGVNSTDGTESYIIIIRKWLFSKHYTYYMYWLPPFLSAKLCVHIATYKSLWQFSYTFFFRFMSYVVCCFLSVNSLWTIVIFPETLSVLINNILILQVP